jgi:predicted HicB family RNase H-like nuclease
MVKKPTLKSEVRTQIRLPAKLHAALVKAAQQNRRSLNAEMLVRLERGT